MAKSKLVKANEKIAEGVVAGYKKIEDGVVSGYKKIENGVVGGFSKMTDKFVDEFLTKEGESVEEAKKRLAREQAQRESGSRRYYWLLENFSSNMDRYFAYTGLFAQVE